MNALESAQVHRFREAVAFWVKSPEGRKAPTVYLTPDLARQLASALLACADDVEARPFTESTAGTVTIGPAP